MRSEDFGSLDQFDQYILLYENATLIGERENADYKYILYQWNDFYVEFRLTKSNLKEAITAFTDCSLLGPYLDDIDLNELKELKIHNSV